MKKYILLLLTLHLTSLISLPTYAQSYSKLWKQAETAIRNDLPQSALTAVNTVYQKALTDGNDAQLLRASLMQRLLWNDIAPDSGKVVLKQMEAAYASEKRPIERAMWASALAQVHATFRNDTAHHRKARLFFLQSLDSLSLLSQARTDDYLPLLKHGKHSRYFSNDLLHVLQQVAFSSNVFSREEKRLHRARVSDHYRQKGMREPLLLLTLDSLKEESCSYTLPEHDSTFVALCQLAHDFVDLPLNVETYITLCKNANKYPPGTHRDSIFYHLAEEGWQRYHREKRAVILKNYIEKARQAQAEWHNLPQTAYPGKEYAVYLTGKNARHTELRFYRIDIPADNKFILRDEIESLHPAQRKPECKLTHRFPEAAPYHQLSDTLRFTAPEAGIFLCEMWLNGKKTSEQLMHVSRIKPLIFGMTKRSFRIIPTDALSGAVISGGRVKIFNRRTHALIGTYEAEHDGSIKLELPNEHLFQACVMTDTDTSAAPFNIYANGNGYQPDTTGTRLRVYTDRGIYRPGQTVHFSGVVYTYSGDEHQVLPRHSFTATLRNQQGKEILSTTLCSDEMGHFSSSFALPEICLPGCFNIECGRGTTARENTDFLVEEYKRPTFTLTPEAPTTDYALGDTISFSVRAATYTDIPLSSLRVRYTITPTAGFHGPSLPDIHGEALTDSLGRCTFPVPLVYDKTEKNGQQPRPYINHSYRIQVEATADNGETASASHTLYAASQPTILSASWPSAICKEQLPKITIALTNAAGKELSAAGTFTVYQEGTAVAQDAFHTHRPFVPEALNSLPSGCYTIITSLHERAETDTCLLKLFSESDTRPIGKDPFHQHIRRNAQGDSVFVVVGSAHRDVLLHYDLLTADTLIESRRIHFSDSLLRFNLAYRPEYGLGAEACFAFVKDDTLHHFSVPIERPRPDKRLLLRWSTFRSRLTPGQTEEWRLRITHPDGSPADAIVMARLYEASLDALNASPWHFALYFHRNSTLGSWSLPASGALSLYGYEKRKRHSVDQLSFTRWDDSLFSLHDYRLRSIRVAAGSAKSALGYAQPRHLAMTQNSITTNAANEDALLREAVVLTKNNITENSGSTTDFRKNFSETAFFMPKLRTDASGTVTLAFTLPESLTSWNFTAFAHSARMDYALLDTTVVARREFMVQAAMPRYVRAGDRVTLPATLQNISGKEISGRFICRIAEAQKEQTLHTFTHPYCLKPGESRTVEITFPTDDKHPMLVCRFMAEGGEFSDGEEHFLPVLSHRVPVVRSIPFSMEEAGTRTLRIDTLWTDIRQAENRRLHVELSAQPMGYVLSALPAIFCENGENATQRSTQLYAVVLADFIAQSHPNLRQFIESTSTTGDTAISHEESPLERHPELKQVLMAESPWEAQAAAEVERRKALVQLFNSDMVSLHKQSAIDRLRDLQTPEGGWSWFKGMPANEHITADVAIVLARLLHLTGKNSDIQAMLQKAMTYWERQIHESVKWIKENEQRTGRKSRITEHHLRYLYVCSLVPGEKSAEAAADLRFLCEKAELQLPEMDMHSKALAAVVLQTQHKDTAAQTALRSLLEHTVVSPEMGRYFDSQRAPLTSRTYRIPTQVATIEALHHVNSPESSDFTEEMQLWLLQSKRTQMWETSRASADAIYALMLMNSQDADTTFFAAGETSPMHFSLLKGKQTLYSDTSSEKSASLLAGHTLHTFDNPSTLRADRIIIENQSNHLSWGAVMAHYTLPADAVKTSGSGLFIKEEWQIKEGSTWRTISLEETPLSIGRHLRRVFTLTAERDFDFVSLRTSRAACLVPTRPLSGYFRADHIHGYRAVHDASTDFFFEKLNKGIHVFTEEYLTDRSGIYHSGLTSAQCVYAPEFSAQTSGSTLQVYPKSSGENSSICPSAN